MVNLSLFSVLCFLTYNILILSTVSGNYFGRDWAVWSKAKRIIEIELADRRALGISPSNELKNFDLFTYGLKYAINPMYMVIPGTTSDNFNLITGNGVLLKNDSLGQIQFEIAMPQRQVNTCGFIITSLKDDTTDYISNMKVYWKSALNLAYDVIAKPDTGETLYRLNLKTNHENAAFFFDSVPAKYFKFLIFPMSSKPIKLRIASINKCIYNNRHIIVNCGEKMERNKKFEYLKPGVPISIKCPIDCIRTWPCWGFKIYSSDSPICWTARQNFGQWGNGEYTIYKIAKNFFFRDEVNPLLNNGVYCRKSVVRFPAFAFDRKYYDFANKETKGLESSIL